MKPELLSPCHDTATLKAAIKAGADAVYFGVKEYNMRHKAKNFTQEELKSVVKECHDNKIKAYLTVNAVIYENELEKLNELLVTAKEAGVNAVIVHDLAALKMAKDKGMNTHISTQANVTNSASANTYKSLGADRVILSRELSLNQIRKIIKNTSLPIEIFIHGAMCVSISGRCFLSQAQHLKNANRGECLQPCRREWSVKNEDGELVYDGERFLNAKDLCMIEHVPELLELNVKSLKIEGRMRDANYVYTVTKCYREAIDCFKKEKINEWIKKLKSVFNRGFCTGFYHERPDNEVSLKKHNNQSSTKKQLIGKIIEYEEGVATILLREQDLENNDEIMIIGSNFFKQLANANALKGEIIKVKVVEMVNVGDLVYKLIK